MAQSFWLNGSPANSIALNDRGLMLADAVFETVKIREGQICLWSRHRARLKSGLQALAFTSPQWVVLQIENELERALRTANYPNGIARITVTRGYGPRGYLPPAEAESNRIIQLDSSLPEAPKPAKISFCEGTYLSPSAIGPWKLTSRVEHTLAAMEARDRGLDDAIMLDTQGSVISLISSNLFIRQGSTLVTPMIEKVGIRGTRRQELVNLLAPRLGIPCEVRPVSKADIMAADEMFCSNAVWGLRAIQQCDDWSSESSEMFDSLRIALGAREREATV